MKRSIAGPFPLLAHEVGHLLGAHHDRATSPEDWPGQLPYARGYRFEVDGVTYTDVMAYEPGTLIPNFSNPNVLFRGVATGITNDVDNARAVNIVAPVVARYNEATNRFAFTTNLFAVARSASAGIITVRRSGDLATACSVRWQTFSSTAVAGVNFIAGSGTLAFAPGQTEQSFSVTIVDGPESRGDRIVNLRLSNPSSGSALNLQSSAQLLIVETGAYFEFANTAASAFETDPTANLLVRRMGDTSVSASVDFAMLDGAAGNADYVSSAGTLQFAAGETEKTLLVPVLFNTEPEPDETFTVRLLNPSAGAALGVAAQVTITIIDEQRSGALLPSSFPADRTSGRVLLPRIFDGRYLVLKTFTNEATMMSTVASLLPDGSVDPSFQTIRLSIAVREDAGFLYGVMRSIIPLEDGRFYLLGNFAGVNGSRRSKIARFLPNGALDPSFDPGIGPNGHIQDLVVRPDGKLLIAGAFSTISGQEQNSIALLNDDGTFDGSFRPEIRPFGYWAARLALQDDGKLLAAGWFDTVNSSNRSSIVRLLANGELDKTFAGPKLTPAFCEISQVLPLADGKILVAGFFQQPRSRIMRLHSSGQLDPTFTPPVINDSIRLMELMPDGRILIAGGFTRAGNTARGHIARLLPDGRLDTSFDPGKGANDYIGGSVYLRPLGGMEVTASGELLVSGEFSSFSQQPRPGFARLTMDSAQAVVRGIAKVAAGSFELKVHSLPGGAFRLETSTNLADWVKSAPARPGRPYSRIKVPGSESREFYRVATE